MFVFLRRLIARSGKCKAKGSAPPSGNEPSSPISVSYNGIAVILSVEGQVTQKIAWSEIDLIAICIEDEFLPFPYWYVGNRDNLLRIPNDAVGGNELFFDGFGESLSGYKSDATFKIIIEASAAMEGTFIVWRSEKPAAA